VLLVAIVLADRGRSGRQSAIVRVLSIALVVVLVAEAAGVTTRLITDLVKGGPETNSPPIGRRHAREQRDVLEVVTDEEPAHRHALIEAHFAPIEAEPGPFLDLRSMPMPG
jgi:hypothetical protein